MITSNRVPWVEDWRMTILAAGLTAILALLVGVSLALQNWFLTGAVVGLVLLAVLARIGPFPLLMIELVVGPFLVGRVINLGAGVPDLSAERILIPFTVVVLLAEWVIRKRPLPKLGVEDGLLAFFVAWGLLSVFVWKPDNLSVQFQEFALYLLPLMAYLVARSTLTSERNLKLLMLVAVPMLLVICVVVPPETLNHVSVLGVSSEIVAGVARAQSFFRNAWEFGTIAGMLLALCVHSLTASASPFMRRLAILAVLIGFPAIILTFMRSSWIGLLVVLLLLLWQVPRSRIPAAIALVVLVVVAVLFLPTLTQTDVWTGRIADSGNVQGRVLLLEEQWRLFLTSPILGVGVGGLTTTLFDFSSQATAISHNSYVGHLISFGVIGMSYFVAIAMILLKSVDTYRRLPVGKFVGRELIAALWGGALVFLVVSASLETRVFIYMTTLFWIILGTLVAIRQHFIPKLEGSNPR